MNGRATAAWISVGVELSQGCWKLGIFEDDEDGVQNANAAGKLKKRRKWVAGIRSCVGMGGRQVRRRKENAFHFRN